MSAGFPAGLPGAPLQGHRAFSAAQGTDMDQGDPVVLDVGEFDGISAKQPTLALGLVRNFLGILRENQTDGAFSDTNLLSEGVVACNFKNHASAAAGTYATPVNGQDYLTYSPKRTNVVLLTNQTSGTAVHTPGEGVAAPKVLILPDRTEGGELAQQYWADPAVAAEAAIHAAITGSASAIVTTTTVITNPDYPRNVVINPDGVAADVAACDITINGTDIYDAVLTEDIAIAENQAHDTLSTGLKAFKTVTSIVIPIQDGAGATFHIGTGSKLGLDRKLRVNTVLAAALNSVREGTAPTVTVSPTVVALNTMTLNSSLAGTPVDAWFIDHL